MNRFDMIAGKLVEGKSTYLDELRYAVSVVEGKIAAYQEAMSILFWVERAKGIMFNKRALLTSQIGPENYRKAAVLFDEWHRAWTEVAKAEEKVGEAKEAAFEIGKKNPDLRSILEPQTGVQP